MAKVLGVLSIVFYIAIVESLPYPSAELKTLSLEDLIPAKAEFYPERFNVQWLSENEFIYSDPSFGVKKYNAESDVQEKYIDNDDMAIINKYAFLSFSEDHNYLLLITNRKKVYRYSSTAEYVVYNKKDKTLTKIGDGQQLQAAVWGSDNSIAYVLKNNVYYLPNADDPSRVVLLTKDGVPGQVYYGVTDWIYEEEIFDAAEALWFSPKSSYLAVASFNDTNVESAVYPYYGDPLDVTNQYPQSVKFKYPKAGSENPIVGLRVYKMQNLEEEPWIIPAPVDVIGVDHVLGRVNWASDHNLIVFWLNRRQNISVLVNCDLNMDKCDLIQERTEPNGWIDITEPIFDKLGTQILDIQPLYNEEQRFKHATLFNFKTLEAVDLSPGNSTVTELLGWNYETNTTYYLVSPSVAPWERQVWSNTNGVVRCISCQESSCHSVTASFAPGGGYAIFGCSASNITPKYFLYKSQKNTFKLLKDNAKLDTKLSEYKRPIPLFTIVPLSNDVVAHVRLLLPSDMKPNTKYPMIVKVYAGPGTTRVKDAFELDYSTYLATNRSFIVCYVDVRGSGAMSVEALHSINNALGTLEVTDTLFAIRKLIKIHKFIDEKRIGVWGWSYGGFTTGMMLANDNRNTIACAAAVAPVTSWLYYDSIYTERFMDTPAHNGAGYEQSSLINVAERLRGRRLLLIHGSGDDNVHYQNSMLLAKRLQHLDIAFEQMSYADENHSLLGVSRHLYHTLDNFWTECFARPHLHLVPDKNL